MSFQKPFPISSLCPVLVDPDVSSQLPFQRHAPSVCRYAPYRDGNGSTLWNCKLPFSALFYKLASSHCHGNRKITKTSSILVLRPLLIQLSLNSCEHIPVCPSKLGIKSITFHAQAPHECLLSFIPFQSMTCTVTGNNQVLLMAHMNRSIRD